MIDAADIRLTGIAVERFDVGIPMGEWVGKDRGGGIRIGALMQRALESTPA